MKCPNCGAELFVNDKLVANITPIQPGVLTHEDKRCPALLSIGPDGQVRSCQRHEGHEGDHIWLMDK